MPSFYGIVHRTKRCFVIVNGGPDDHVDVLIDFTCNDYESATLHYDYKLNLHALFDGVEEPCTLFRLQFTENNGSVVHANYLHYDESGLLLDIVHSKHNHYSAMNLANLVLLWDRIRNDLPKAIQDAVKTSSRIGKEIKDDEICAICLEEYQEEDTIGTMVRCKHSYHEQCIKEWLQRNAQCAICRANAFPINFKPYVLGG